jgi:hypothetical protein
VAVVPNCSKATPAWRNTVSAIAGILVVGYRMRKSLELVEPPASESWTTSVISPNPTSNKVGTAIA